MRPEEKPDPKRRCHFASVNGVQYPYPRCALCDRDVAAFTWADHFEHDGERPMRTFFVACHGEIDSATFALDELRRIKTNELVFATAFGPKAIEASEEDPPRLLRE